MLTDPGLLELIAAGRLVPWRPAPGMGVKAVRHLLMTPAVEMAVNRDPWERGPGELAREAMDRRRQFLALLGRFVNGDMLSPMNHVKVLRPTSADFRDLLEVRSGPPDPQTRLFGYVYRPGCWIGTGFHLRSDLGDLGDPAWLRAARASRAAWRDLFPDREPHPAPHPCDSKTKLGALLDG
jgi:hypothetical protein